MPLSISTMNEQTDYIVFTHYENYKGGVNNLQVSTVVCPQGKTVKRFTSTVGKATNKARLYVKKLNQI